MGVEQWKSQDSTPLPNPSPCMGEGTFFIIPTLRVGMQPMTL